MIYSSLSRSAISDQGRTVYLMFTKAVTLTQIMRQNGEDSGLRQFRELLLRLRDGRVTVADWELLTISHLHHPAEFANAIHLHCTVLYMCVLYVLGYHSALGSSSRNLDQKFFTNNIKNYTVGVKHLNLLCFKLNKFCFCHDSSLIHHNLHPRCQQKIVSRITSYTIDLIHGTG